MPQLELRGAPPSLGRLPHPLSGRRSSPSALTERLRHLVRGPAEDPPWARPGLFGVLVLAALLCLWNLTENGLSNEYYAAAVKSGSVSWKAWFFGSLDPGSFITVDKPPLSLWLGGLSARLFGFSSFSILLPQALAGIASVGLLHATVKRIAGPAAGLTAATLFALTPVSVAIARVNNPDALLVLLMIASAYLVLRAVESGRTKPLVWAGVLVGLAFMTKMLQGWMVVPALGATYLLAGPPALGTRLRQLALAGVALVAASAAWPLAVSLWPGSKPYIGGSTDGTVWDLILGYNGFGRLTGSEGGSGQGTTFGGTAGLWRMFNEQVGGQIAWLLPLAAVGLVAGLVATRRAARTDLLRAGVVLFGVWALVHVAIFSTQKGIFHPYYVSALAPAVAALAAVALVVLATVAKRSWLAHGVLAAAVLGTAALAVELLGRTADFAPALRIVVPVAAVAAVSASAGLRMTGSRARVLLTVAAVAGAIAVTAGPASYSVASVGQALSGSNVLAGPASVSSSGGAGARPGGTGGPPSGSAPTGTAPTGAAQQAAAGGTSEDSTAAGATVPAAATTTGAASGAAGTAGGQSGGGLSDEVISYLQTNQGEATYLLAASGSQTTASVIIATGEPVITIGGFNGADPTPTVDELAQLVQDGAVKYVLVSENGGGGPGGDSGSSTEIATWAAANGTAVTDVTVSGGTLYAVGG